MSLTLRSVHGETGGEAWGGPTTVSRVTLLPSSSSNHHTHTLPLTSSLNKSLSGARPPRRLLLTPAPNEKLRRGVEGAATWGDNAIITGRQMETIRADVDAEREAAPTERTGLPKEEPTEPQSACPPLSHASTKSSWSKFSPSKVGGFRSLENLGEPALEVHARREKTSGELIGSHKRSRY
jgi:hypothetical protein